MEGIRIVNVGEGQIEDLCRLCVPPERRDDTGFIEGMAQKGKWATEMIQQRGSFAKLAYRGSSPVGLIQYEPIPDERAVLILCVYVPDREHWRQNAANELLASLIEEMGEPKDWFGGWTARVLVTRTFPGEKPDQYPARSFFLAKNPGDGTNGKTIMGIPRSRCSLGMTQSITVFNEVMGCRGTRLKMQGDLPCPCAPTIFENS